MARIGSGYSRGCRTCRRRKVKCDEAHPACDRCKKANRKCEGYGRDRRFVDENPRAERRAKRKTVRSDIVHDSPSPSSSATWEVARTPSSDPGIPTSLGLCGFEDNIRVSFLLSNLMPGMPHHYPWLKLHAQDPSPCAQMSIRALGAVYFERIHRLHEAPSIFLDLYSKALFSLNDGLNNSARALSVSVLKTAMTLELYEFIAFNSTSGWLKHAGGVGRLIELRGPLRHQALAERRLLEGSRVIIALKCLVEKKRCFLEQPAWKVIPWAADPESKTLDLYLHDILCDVPGLVEDAMRIQHPQTKSDQRASLRRGLPTNVLVHLQDLYAWRITWQQHNPSACYERPVSTAEEEPIFSTTLHYASLSTATEITFYNAILILLLRLGSQVIGPSFDTSLPHPLLSENVAAYGPLYAPGSAPDAQAIATEICRSVEFHLLEPTSSAGAFYLLFPLRIAHQTFETGSRESRWVSMMLREIADLSGFEIGRNLDKREIA